MILRGVKEGSCVSMAFPLIFICLNPPERKTRLNTNITLAFFSLCWVLLENISRGKVMTYEIIRLLPCLTTGKMRMGPLRKKGFRLHSSRRCSSRKKIRGWADIHVKLFFVSVLLKAIHRIGTTYHWTDSVSWVWTIDWETHLFTGADHFLGIEKDDEKSGKDFNIVPCNIVTLQLKALWLKSLTGIILH